jgi:DNA-binding PadR family transcriptional regulator
MSTRTELTRRVLLALNSMGGQPCSQTILVDAVTIRFTPRPTQGDVEEAIHDAEASGYISGMTDDLEGKLWMLTPKGQLRARSIA